MASSHLEKLPALLSLLWPQNVTTLEKICQAFGITLAQLVAERGEPVPLTDSQTELLERWSRLSKEQQAVIFQLLDIM